MPRTRTRPRFTPSDELLLFVTEPQQLDAVVEFGTETIGPSTIPGALTITDEPCEWDCGGTVGDCWAEDCSCPSCENERALDDDADAYADREW